MASLSTKVKRTILAWFDVWMIRRPALPPGLDLFEDLFEKLGYRRFETVFDVGANVGDMTQLYRQQFPGAKIYAFEPFRYAHGVLSTRFGADPKVVVEQLALSSQAKELELAAQDDEHSVLNSLNTALIEVPTAKKEKIRLETLDRYIAQNVIERIDFMKIDTEGHELEVLRGAARALEQQKIKMIYSEVGLHPSNLRNTSWPELHEYLTGEGFLLYALYNVVHFYNKPYGSFANALYLHGSLLDELKLSRFEWT